MTCNDLIEAALLTAAGQSHNNNYKRDTRPFLAAVKGLAPNQYRMTLIVTDTLISVGALCEPSSTQAHQLPPSTCTEQRAGESNGASARNQRVHGSGCK